MLKAYIEQIIPCAYTILGIESFIIFSMCFRHPKALVSTMPALIAFWNIGMCTGYRADDGTLTVSPTSISGNWASTATYTSDSPAPWQAHAGDIRRVVVGDQVMLSGIFLQGSTIDSITFEGSFLCNDYRGAPFYGCTFTTDIDVSCFGDAGTGDDTHLFRKCVFNGTLSCNLNDTHPTNFLTIANACTINGDKAAGEYVLR